MCLYYKHRCHRTFQINFNTVQTTQSQITQSEQEETNSAEEFEDVIPNIPVAKTNVEEKMEMTERRTLLSNPFRGVSEEDAAEFWTRLKN